MDGSHDLMLSMSLHSRQGEDFLNLQETVKKQDENLLKVKEQLAELQETAKKRDENLNKQLAELQDSVYGGRINHLKEAFRRGIVKEGSTIKYNTAIAKVSVKNKCAVLLYENEFYESFHSFLIAVKGSRQYRKLIIDGVSYNIFLERLKNVKNSSMSSDNTLPSTIPEATLPGNSTSNIDDTLLTEITQHFVNRGFQPSLVSSFLEGNSLLEFMTNEELILDFLDEREQMDPTIFVGVEGNEGVKTGEDKKLLVKWGLTEEASNRLRDGVHDSAWSQRFLKHWLLDWIYNQWDATIQMSLETVFYDSKFLYDQWHSYDGEGGPQMFASSFEEIINMGENTLIRYNTKVSNPMDTNYKAFFHATNYISIQSIIDDGIRLRCCRNDLDFGSSQSFYLNPSLDNAIEFIKKRRIVGFYGIVVYWVDMEKVKSMMYQDLIPNESLWKEVVVASRCGQNSTVDDDDFVYGYQLLNLREIYTAYRNVKKTKDSWKIFIPRARWFEPIRNLQLAVKTKKASEVMNNYQVGIIYFHLK
ncbi:hypothetical protein Glove_279g57 [Diversispora epigaea]|uniref:Uncharacterized protein n=1 Tax=Diversispora epigaea TaxID=1348612 RepID=A0A397I279_9GLOM|nr:hypothetical protein Glove_279g57 [Diversispora epigaea]